MTRVASDDRAELSDLVGAHPPADEAEATARRRFLEELTHLARPWDRHASLVHVTASAVVVGRRGTILHRHRRLHRWLQPGGHLDAGESPHDAAIREVVEETGLRATHPPGGPHLLRVDVHNAALGHTHLDLCYLLVAPDEDPAPAAGESADVRWWRWSDAMAVADSSLRGALDAARALVDEGATGLDREGAT